MGSGAHFRLETSRGESTANWIGPACVILCGIHSGLFQDALLRRAAGFFRKKRVYGDQSSAVHIGLFRRESAWPWAQDGVDARLGPPCRTPWPSLARASPSGGRTCACWHGGPRARRWSPLRLQTRIHSNRGCRNLVISVLRRRPVVIDSRSVLFMRQIAAHTKQKRGAVLSVGARVLPSWKLPPASEFLPVRIGALQSDQSSLGKSMIFLDFSCSRRNIVQGPDAIFSCFFISFHRNPKFCRLHSREIWHPPPEVTYGHSLLRR